MLATIGVPRHTAAQSTAAIPRVGYVFSFTPASGRHLWDACRQGLRDLGYVEGRTIHVEPRFAHDRHDALQGLVADLLRLRVDVIVTAATPATQAARAATRTVPIVMVAVAEPVRAGLVTTLARPGGNVTGLTLLTPELSGKRLEFLSALGGVSRVAVLAHPGNFSHTVFLEETRKAAQSTGSAVHVVEARTGGDLEAALDAARAQADALIVFDDPVLWSHRARIVELAARRRLPVMYGYREFVDEGGLMAYGPSRPDLYRRTASYVDKILKGADPADLPVERPTKFFFVINLRTATALGVTIPQALLVRATDIIQ